MSNLNILAIDSSTDACSVALKYKHDVFERFEIAPKQHTKLLLPFVDELLSETGISLSDLDGIAFTSGPGSFTGLRMAASLVQSLAFAADLPVVPVSTLATIAQGVSAQLETQSPILVAMDARMQQVYLGGYEVEKHHLVSNIMDDCVIKPEDVELPSTQMSWIGVGSGWKEYEDRFSGVVLEHVELIEEEIYPKASDVIKLAEPKFLANEVLDAAQAQPVYLSDYVTE